MIKLLIMAVQRLSADPIALVLPLEYRNQKRSLIYKFAYFINNVHFVLTYTLPRAETVGDQGGTCLGYVLKTCVNLIYKIPVIFLKNIPAQC